MSRPITLNVLRGTTLTSGEYFSVNETVPDNITYAQLLAGIANATYTLKALENKTYKGQVRNSANSTLMAELQFTVLSDRVSFYIPASITETWPNKSATFFYDVFETDTLSGIVRSIAQGNINVIPAITIPDED